MRARACLKLCLLHQILVVRLHQMPQRIARRRCLVVVVAFHKASQLLDVLDRVLQDVNLGHLLGARSSRNVKSKTFVSSVHRLYSVSLSLVPSLNSNGHRWLYGIPKGGMEYCPLPTTSSSSSSSSMALSWTNASFLHLLRCQDFLHVFTS